MERKLVDLAAALVRSAPATWMKYREMAGGGVVVIDAGGRKHVLTQAALWAEFERLEAEQGSGAKPTADEGTIAVRVRLDEDDEPAAPVEVSTPGRRRGRPKKPTVEPPAGNS